jgi:acetate kinase
MRGMTLLTINSGSTSVKLAAFASGNASGAPELLQRETLSATADQAREVVGGFIQRHQLSPIDAVAHRVVHGGTRFTQAVRIDAAVVDALTELSALAPLHNPVALRWIAAARSLFGADVAQFAVFDTAFFARLPRVATEYAVPAALGTALGVRRYGFHGLAHEAMWQRWRQLRPDLSEGGRLISLQLGGGCSMAAIDRGRPIDTTMGFSPLEGLVMATRSGDVDAAIVPFLANRRGVTADRIVELLNREAGLLGVSGRSSDMRMLLGDPSPEAQLAVELYCYRARKYVGAFLAVLGGCDGIVFGGGVGEHIPQIREGILGSLRWAGIELDTAANAAALGQDARISAASSPTHVHVVAVDEEHVLACAALSCLRAST